MMLWATTVYLLYCKCYFIAIFLCCVPAYFCFTWLIILYRCYSVR